MAGAITENAAGREVLIRILYPVRSERRLLSSLAPGKLKRAQGMKPRKIWMILAVKEFCLLTASNVMILATRDRGLSENFRKTCIVCVSARSERSKHTICVGSGVLLPHRHCQRLAFVACVNPYRSQPWRCLCAPGKGKQTLLAESVAS